MRFSLLAYSCVYPIGASSREEALNRVVAFCKERKVAASLAGQEGKKSFIMAYVNQDGDVVKKYAGWDGAKSSEPAEEPPIDNPE